WQHENVQLRTNFQNVRRHTQPSTRRSHKDSVSLPKHSYWFDLWVFLVFDIMLFFFVYFVVP
uniref:Uncharacterized protein n=1 Tax=Takifugu rubripes TaxID=31033 RepID=A0A674NJS3_TAKRU